LSLWAIVPMKALNASKSRLREVLTPEQRVELSRGMLLHLLQVLADIPEIERTVVVSADPAVLALTEEHGADALMEKGSPSLNSALSQATALAEYSHVEAVLVLPADLPLIEAAEVQDLIERVQDPPVIIIAPDRRREGTNALLVAPPGTIKYGFGPDSFERHTQRAEASGARIEIMELPALGLDLDTPEDLEIYRERFALMKE